MVIHNTSSLRIFFGDKKNSLSTDNYPVGEKPHTLINHQLFFDIQKQIKCQELYFLKQVHSTHGECITHESGANFMSFAHEGDFLITDGHDVGLGVVTADCLPIVLYDVMNHVVAIVHAGWRGSVNGVVKNTVETMQKKYNTNPLSLQCFFGPSIKVCCYEVGNEVVTQAKKHSFSGQAFERRQGKVFFNVSLFNQLFLMQLGVLKKNISLTYNQCTHCFKQFYSYRRDNGDKQRNITIAALK